MILEWLRDLAIAAHKRNLWMTYLLGNNITYFKNGYYHEYKAIIQSIEHKYNIPSNGILKFHIAYKMKHITKLN